MLTLGHVTATELKNALEYMNQNPLGGRAPRKVDYSYINTLLKKGEEFISNLQFSSLLLSKSLTPSVRWLNGLPVQSLFGP